MVSCVFNSVRSLLNDKSDMITDYCIISGERVMILFHFIAVEILISRMNESKKLKVKSEVRVVWYDSDVVQLPSQQMYQFRTNHNDSSSSSSFLPSIMMR